MAGKYLILLGAVVLGGIVITTLIGGLLAPKPTISSYADVNAPVPASSIPPNPGWPIIGPYRSGIAKIDKSIEEARAHLPYFWQHQQAPATGEEDFSVRVAFPAIRDGKPAHDLIWVTGVNRVDDRIGGRLGVVGVNGVDGSIDGPLALTSDLMPNLRDGDVVSMTEDMIIDWGFRRGNKLIGFYYLRITLEEFAPAEADQIRTNLGENPK
ncbi:MAG TPA: DUF2314 domain-containing protein [Hyphomonadaceae bacterium]|nr:DUF2314 domain-containing protein [Hyphomonadaceae bacterium]